MAEFTEAELEAYLEEALDANRAAEVERAVREDPELLRRLARINDRRDAGIHTIGEIWRRRQIGVPSREDIGSFLLGGLSEEKADYIRFRIEVLKCPYTIATFKDLQGEQTDSSEQSKSRREKYFSESARLLNDPPNQ